MCVVDDEVRWNDFNVKKLEKRMKMKKKMGSDVVEEEVLLAMKKETRNHKARITEYDKR